MANTDAPSPLSFGLDESLYQHLRKASGAKGSVSSLIRNALEAYDFSQFKSTATRQRQVSVRMGADERKKLEKTARSKKASVGELVRAALVAYLDEEIEASEPKSKKKPAKRKTQAREKEETFAASSSAVAKKTYARTLARKRLRRK